MEKLKWKKPLSRKKLLLAGLLMSILAAGIGVYAATLWTHIITWSSPLSVYEVSGTPYPFTTSQIGQSIPISLTSPISNDATEAVNITSTGTYYFYYVIYSNNTISSFSESDSISGATATWNISSATLPSSTPPTTLANFTGSWNPWTSPTSFGPGYVAVELTLVVSAPSGLYTFSFNS